MARRHSLAQAALLLVVCGMIARCTAMPMHPDVLSFVKMAMPSSAEEELQQTAARKLQQDSEDDLFRDGNGPFTFDGFGFGYGGFFPGGGFPDGFGVNVYNIIFRDILNEGLNQYLATGLSNNPLQPFDFIPPTIGRRFNRDVVTLFGYDAVDKFVGQYLTRAEAELGELIDGGCVGPTYSVLVDAGECEINDDGSVECSEPTIKLHSTPYICNLPYRSAASLEGQSFQYKVDFGRERKGELGLPAGVYNFGAAVNITTPNLGYSTLTYQLLDDFGVQQWYQFVTNLVLNELLRIQAALLSGAVDSRILTEAVRDAQNRSSIARGAAAVADASSMLLDRIAGIMGIKTDDLFAGLQALGALPKAADAAPAQPPKQQPRQQQASVQQQRARSRNNGIVANNEVDEGGKEIVSKTKFEEGDLSLLDKPLVRKAEGAQPQAAAKPAPKQAAKPAAAEKKPKL